MKEFMQNFWSVTKKSYTYLLIGALCFPVSVFADFDDEGMKSIGIAILVILGIPIVIGLVWGCICIGFRIIRGFLGF